MELPGEDGDVDGIALHLNTAGDEDLVDELTRLEVDVVLPDGDVIERSYEGETLGSTVILDDLPAAVDVVLRTRGFDGGDLIATGDSPPLEITAEDDEIWALLARRGSFVELEGHYDQRHGHAVVAVAGGAVVVGGEGIGEYEALVHLARRDDAGFYLTRDDDGPALSEVTAARITGGEVDGMVFIAGGANTIEGSSHVSDRYLVWDPATGTYAGEGGLLAEPRFGAVAAPLADGVVAMLGGVTMFTDTTVYFSGRVELVDAVSGSLGSVDEEVHWLHDVATMGDGTAVTCGGFVIAPSGTEMMAWSGCTTVDPDTRDVVTTTGALQRARAGATLVALGDEGDELLALGGLEGSLEWVPTANEEMPVVDSAEILAVDADGLVHSQEIVPLVHARAFPVAFRLADADQVMVCGGRDATSARSDCELYDEAGRVFTEVDGLFLPSVAHSSRAAVLDDGRVLIVGGDRGTGSSADVGVIYVP